MNDTLQAEATYDEAPVMAEADLPGDAIVVYAHLDLSGWSWVCGGAECSSARELDTTAEALADAREHAERYAERRRVEGKMTTVLQPVVVLDRPGLPAAWLVRD